MPITNSDGKVKWNRLGQEMFLIQAPGKPGCGIIQRLGYPEHDPGLIFSCRFIGRNRDFLSKYNNGTGSRKQLQCIPPVGIRKINNAYFRENIYSFLIEKSTYIQSHFSSSPI